MQHEVLRCDRDPREVRHFRKCVATDGSRIAQHRYALQCVQDDQSYVQGAALVRDYVPD